MKMTGPGGRDDFAAAARLYYHIGTTCTFNNNYYFIIYIIIMVNSNIPRTAVIKSQRVLPRGAVERGIYHYNIIRACSLPLWK